MDNYIDIGPECFTNGSVISYKGENYYHSCDVFVIDRPEGGQSFCVKRIGHPGTIHEAYDGTTLDENEKDLKFDLQELRLQWTALVSNPTDAFMLLPKEALIASIRDLVGELLERTKQYDEDSTPVDNK